MARRIIILVLLLLHTLGARAQAMDLRLVWQHPGAAEFLAFVDQPAIRPDPIETIWSDPVADDDGFYRMTVSGIDPAYEAVVFLLAADSLGDVSVPSNIVRISPADLCGTATCGDTFDCTRETCTAQDCLTYSINTRCNDGNTCTLDFCDLFSGCIHIASSGSCDDGLDCTIFDHCSDGVCTGTPDCPADTYCDTLTGTCEIGVTTTTTLLPASTTSTTTSTTTTLQAPPACGDGHLDPDEHCDDGDTEWHSGEVCRADCSLVFCGDTDGSGVLSVSDALFILKTALGTNQCDPAVCDVDNTRTQISASDALRLLRAALGLPVELDCPDPA